MGFSNHHNYNETPSRKYSAHFGGCFSPIHPARCPISSPSYGWSQAYPNIKRDDILGHPIPLYSFPTDEQCRLIIDKIQTEVDIRAVHFIPPQIIVDIDPNSSKQYQRHSLPAEAGGQRIQYHHAPEGYFKGSSQMAYQRLVTPSSVAVDNSDYLQQSPHKITPGVCLSSAFLTSQGLISSNWWSTTAGLYLQKDNKQCLTVSNHGFPHSPEVYHPGPLGRRIGQIVDRRPAWDIAFVELDPSINFSNESYFQAPKPSRMIRRDELRAGEWFEVDGHSTGRIDICMDKKTFIPFPIPFLVPSGTLEIKIPAARWKVENVGSLFGAVGNSIRTGICGAPIVDKDGRVVGFFHLVDDSGLLAFTESIDFIINEGWSLV